jgi:hypothetical protein
MLLKLPMTMMPMTKSAGRVPSSGRGVRGVIPGRPAKLPGLYLAGFLGVPGSRGVRGVFRDIPQEKSLLAPESGWSEERPAINACFPRDPGETPRTPRLPGTLEIPAPSNPGSFHHTSPGHSPSFPRSASQEPTSSPECVAALRSGALTCPPRRSLHLGPTRGAVGPRSSLSWPLDRSHAMGMGAGGGSGVRSLPAGSLGGPCTGPISGECFSPPRTASAGMLRGECFSPPRTASAGLLRRCPP